MTDIDESTPIRTIDVPVTIHASALDDVVDGFYNPWLGTTIVRCNTLNELIHSAGVFSHRGVTEELLGRVLQDHVDAVDEPVLFIKIIPKEVLALMQDAVRRNRSLIIGSDEGTHGVLYRTITRSQASALTKWVDGKPYMELPRETQAVLRLSTKTPRLATYSVVVSRVERASVLVSVRAFDERSARDVAIKQVSASVLKPDKVEYSVVFSAKDDRG